MDNVIWMVLLIGFVMAAAATEKTVYLWFAGCGLAALIVSMLGAPVFPQVLVFLIVLVLGICFTQPALIKHLLRRLTGKKVPSKRKRKE